MSVVSDSTLPPGDPRNLPPFDQEPMPDSDPYRVQPTRDLLAPLDFAPVDPTEPSPLKLDPNIKPAEFEAKLTRDQAIKYMVGMLALPGDFVQKNSLGLRPLLNAMVMILPDEALYESVLAQLDLAQVIRPVADEAMRALAAGRDSIEVRGVVVPLGQEAVQQAGFLYQHAEQMQRDNLQAFAESKGWTSGQARDELLANYRTQLAGDTLGKSPSQLAAEDSLKETETGQGAESPTEFGDTALDSGPSSLAPLLTSADITELFRNFQGDDQSLINQVRGYESQYSAQQAGEDVTALAPGEFNIRYDQGNIVTRDASRPTDEYARGGQAARPYAINEALQLPYTMTRDELRALNKNLKRAGYYADNDGPLMDDDPTDPRLQAAWRRAIGDSVRSGTPIVQNLQGKTKTLLANKVLDAEGNLVPEAEKVTRPDRTNVQLSDPEGLRWDADGMAMKLLGRTLRPDELDYLVDTVHNLERGQARQFDIANAKTGGGGVYEQVDSTSKVNAWLKMIMPIDDADPDTDEHPLTADEFKMRVFGPKGGELPGAGPVSDLAPVTAPRVPRPGLPPGPDDRERVMR